MSFRLWLASSLFQSARDDLADRRHPVGDVQPGGGFGRHIFEGVDGDIDAAVEQGFFQFFGEVAAAFEFTERTVGDAVALGMDDLKVDMETECGFELRNDVSGLGAGKFAAAGADDHGGDSLGLSVFVHNIRVLSGGNVTELLWQRMVVRDPLLN